MIVVGYTGGMVPVLALVFAAPPAPLLVRVYDLGHPVQAFAASADGRHFAAVRDGNQIDLYDARSGKLRHGVRFNDGDRVRTLSFSPDGKALAGGADSNAELRVWSVESGELLFAVGDHPGGVCTAAFAPDGKTIATAARDETVRLIEAHTGTVRKVIGETREAAGGAALTFDPTGRHLIVAAAGKPGQVLDAATGEPVRPLVGYSGPDSPLVAVSADGRTLLTTRRDRGFDVWETVTGRRRWMTRPDAVRGAAFAPDGWSVAVAYAGHVEVRGPRLGESGTDIAVPGECVGCTAAGGKLFTVGDDVRVWLWPAPKSSVRTWQMSDLNAARAELNSTAEELAELLAGSDAARAHAAIGTLLTRDPADVVRLAKPSLRALPVAGPKAAAEVRRLVPDLTHRDFRVRDAASRRLLELARGAPVEVLKAAKEATDPEAAARLADIVRAAKLAGLDINVEAVRWLEVLELLNTPAARAVVAELAAGDAEAELTRDAIETLKRMRERRPGQ
jgi:hypothetical protein